VRVVLKGACVRVRRFVLKGACVRVRRIQATFGDNILIGYGNWSRDTQMKHFMPTMNQGLRKQIHKRFDTITINEFNTSKLCCDCSQELTHYKDKKNTEVYRLFCCVSCPNKKIVFRTRDANSAVNIRKLTRSWIESQTRPSAFSRKQCLSPVVPNTGKRKTIVVKTTSMVKHNC
jgi:hypothetical protein